MEMSKFACKRINRCDLQQAATASSNRYHTHQSILHNADDMKFKIKERIDKTVL